MVTYLIEAQTIKSTVQNIGVAVDQRKKYRTQNEHEIYLFISIQSSFHVPPTQINLGGCGLLYISGIYLNVLAYSK